MSKRDLARKVREAATGVDLRMGTIISVTPGLPTKVSATIGDVTFTGIPVLDGFVPVVGDSFWFAALGGGKLLGVGGIGGGSAPGPWQVPSLSAGWGNYGGGFAQFAYRKTLGKVELNGLLLYTGATLGPGNSSTITTGIEVGYRPNAQILLGGMRATDQGQQMADVRAHTGGSLTVILDAGARNFVAGQWLSVNGLEYPIP